MLESLLNGKEISPSVIIKDTYENPGRNLFQCWRHHLSQRFQVIDIACGSNRNAESVVIDCADDSLDIRSDASSLADAVLSQLLSHSLFPDPSTPVVFLLPDLDALFLLYPSRSIFSLLNSLLRLRPSSLLLGLLHLDCFPPSLLPALDYFARTTVTLLPVPADARSSFSCQLRLFHKKSSGKVIRSQELARFSSTAPARVVRVVDAEALNKSRPRTEIRLETDGTDAATDPTSNLTFNLTLSEEEKSARERVVLPFDKNRSGRGRIIYEAEEEDDLDEEDPDDDLNI